MANEAKLDEIMLDLGFPENLTGTRYVREAVRRYRPGMSMTKELYPAIAKACSSTPFRVERCMRHATEIAFERSAWTNAGARYFGSGIGPFTCAPTNGELVARLERLTRED